MARKILLADDSVTAQNMGRKILADAGYEVITVNNGSAALKKIAEVKPDLIVLDVYMPGYSGLEVCQRLKETGETSRIPILLTVGKLEPFKPEEAKRVRAEGFIVKPFEASELLSALARLEDKVVPRTESSKPGRFARAIAAVEEGRYDKSVAAQEDSGWKNRIAFPSKKKRKSEEAEDGDDPAIYNPVNKDLRTVVEHKPAAAPQAPAPQAAEPQESRVDLAAVAPEGLPKDVTPEEIAALAAAAAHLQGKVAGVRAEEAKTEEQKAEEVKGEDVRALAPAAAIAHHEVPAPSATVESPAPEIAATSAMPAEQPAEEKSSEPALLTVAATVTEDAAAASPADVAAIDAIEKAPVPITSATGSGNGSGTHEPVTRTEVEPVTMAVAAGAEGSFGAARWIAVPVALAPEEASVILEEEMRKAHAAMSEPVPAPHENSFATVAEIPVEQHEAAAEVISPVESAATIQTATIEPATIEPANSEAASQVAAAATGFDGGASMASVPVPQSSPYTVKEFETVAPSATESFAAAESAPTASVESISTSAPEASAASNEIATHSTPEPVAAAPLAPPKQEETTRLEDWPKEKEEVPKEDEPKIEEPVAGASMSATALEQMSQATAEPIAEAAPPSIESHTELTQPERTAPAAGNKEPDFAATTAAAWANWRKVRESAEPGASANRDEQDMAAAKEAAMAAAAGAEKAPDEGPEIESIVDSVLADLRPKIVAEISKKLKKKK